MNHATAHDVPPRTFDSEEVRTDLTVVGGGLSGVCAAIAAARSGLTVALVHNRTVLGGNSSSEVRVWVCGATSHGVHHFARETGIMGELFVENQFRNPGGNPHLWDLVLLDAVLAEPRIRLFLDTDVRDVVAEGPPESRTIRSVTGWSMGSQRTLEFASPQFVDASGDSLVGYLAGADFRAGREARDEHGETLAPIEPDADTLGSTLLFYVKDAGRPVPFVAPDWAVDIGSTPVPITRDVRANASGCEYWWIELGGDRDVVADNDEIRRELQGAVLGIWDYIKNSGKFEAENLDLEWVGSLPGKREYRRLVGDYILKEHDVLEQRPHDDAVTFGGWSLDLHPPGGMYASGPGSRHWYSDGTYDIPLRSLYSRNVKNLWMSGRNISATHVAFGSTRVMATCASEGEAVGLAAAVVAQTGANSREVAGERIGDLRHLQIRFDASMQGLRHTDRRDAALSARLRASSTEANLGVLVPTGELRLEKAIGLVLPVEPRLDGLELLVDVAAPTTLVVRLHSTSGQRNYLPDALIAEASIALLPGAAQWVPLGFEWEPDAARNAFVVIAANDDIVIRTGEGPLPGVTTLVRRDAPAEPPEHPKNWRDWKRLEHRTLPCFRTSHTAAYGLGKLVGGYARPWGGPHVWLSERLERDPQPWVELAWDQSIDTEEIGLVFDDDVEEDLINLHHHDTAFRVIPELVKDYTVEVREGDQWREIATVTGNRRRLRRHSVTSAAISGLRVHVHATNGAPRAHIVGIRAWLSGSHPQSLAS